MRRTLDIRSVRSDYVTPSTSVGLVSNHAIDLRGSSDGYRSANVYGNTWLGLPGRSFGYASWYGGRSRAQGRSTSSQGMSSYYLQKNFSGTYVRAGKQNSVDYASGSVSTVLTPSFDRFVTIGSQDNLRSQRNAGSLVLYATAEGNYEFYRNGRLVEAAGHAGPQRGQLPGPARRLLPAGSPAGRSQRQCDQQRSPRHQ